MNENNLNLFNDDKFIDNKKFVISDEIEERKLIKSKKRVQDYGEVFTPSWMVKKMLSFPKIQKKLMNLDSTFFEPSAGEGAFLVEILKIRMNYVNKISNKKNWCDNATRGLMSIYAIEYMNDNLKIAKNSMLKIIINNYEYFYQENLKPNSDFYKNCCFILNKNIVQGDTLTYKNSLNEFIEFNHWNIKNGKVLRTSFYFKSLFGNGYDEKSNLLSKSQQLSLFDDIESEIKYKASKITQVYKEEVEIK